jgi:glyoxylase-like metal-dependent hydrolase (beta-lactamase superfamily II)
MRSNAYRDSVLPVIESGQAQLIDGNYAIDDTLLIEPAPGHTLGHMILKLEHAGKRALFCGDVVHHPLQVYAPQWNSVFCELPEQARATRRCVLDHCADENALLFPAHFAAPHVAVIARDGETFRPEFVAGSRLYCD